MRIAYGELGHLSKSPFHMHAENVRKSLPANGYAPYARPKLAYARGSIAIRARANRS